MKKQLLLTILLTVILCSSGLTQGYSQFGKSDTIVLLSKIFGTERKFIVTKSPGIKKGDKENNCVLYMDADESNINGIFLRSANSLIAFQEMPQSYLIGVIHQDRNKELLEKDSLLRCIIEELIPLLKKNYDISNTVAIAGHSFGAYFATYAFFKYNHVFNSCIAVSPAYWPNKEDVLSLMNEKIKANTVSGSFYLTIGDKRWDEISLRGYVFKARKLVNGSKNIRFDFAELKGFSHNATPTVGFGSGLGFLYDEWEWGNISEEQDRRLKSFPTFWGHLEIKADALFHLDHMAEARAIYREALKDVPKDEDLSAQERTAIIKRINNKIKSCH